MAFTDKEKEILLSAKFVGEKTIKRLEEIGIDSFEKLASADADGICVLVAAHLGASCWKNSPQAKKAINNAILAAKDSIEKND